MATFVGAMNVYLKLPSRYLLTTSFFRATKHMLICNCKRTVSPLMHLHIYPKKHYSSSSSEEISKDEPIAFSKSAAKNHTVNDTLYYDSGRRSSFTGLVITFGMLFCIVYFGFLRQEGETEQKIFNKILELQNSNASEESENDPVENNT
ncbi:uncharacterized protein LOC124447728 [Xenia sp. Carnegie-2017]|uniref:uncharacterized protein LOC124447728 n=1 Tax=Xenia sp. Carnegie-2017 TaxID=2897299 RepID=UPI001F047C86|nr:uncharacterized protein LOC124447728 [Xenia sp. Carnegie-2017]